METPTIEEFKSALINYANNEFNGFIESTLIKISDSINLDHVTGTKYIEELIIKGFINFRLNKEQTAYYYIVSSKYL